MSQTCCRNSARLASRPVIVVPADVRQRVREALSRHLPDVQVLAAEELAAEDRVEVFASVGGGEVLRAA